MGLLQRIADKRNQRIVEHALAQLDEGDEVLRWVRVRRASGERGAGFLYLTKQCVLLHWVVGKRGGQIVTFEEIDNWGVNRSAHIGPILGIEAGETVLFLQIPTMTHQTAESASAFLADFADSAPDNDADLTTVHGLGTFETPGEFKVNRRKKSLTGMVRRVAVTVAGVALIVAAGLIIPIPGPWSFVLTLGGLGLLASEYDWAQDILDWVKEKAGDLKDKVSKRRRSES